MRVFHRRDRARATALAGRRRRLLAARAGSAGPEGHPPKRSREAHDRQDGEWEERPRGGSLWACPEYHAVEREEQRCEDEPGDQQSLLHKPTLQQEPRHVGTAGALLLGGLPVIQPYVSLTPTRLARFVCSIAVTVSGARLRRQVRRHHAVGRLGASCGAGHVDRAA
jgi:hypothetical protein